MSALGRCFWCGCHVGIENRSWWLQTTWHIYGYIYIWHVSHIWYIETWLKEASRVLQGAQLNALGNIRYWERSRERFGASLRMSLRALRDESKELVMVSCG